MTNEEYQKQNADLIRQLHAYEYENRELREALAIVQDQLDHEKRDARLGAVVNSFLKELKEALR